MKNFALIYGVAFGLCVARLKAGSVVTLADGSEIAGKLTLKPAAVRVEGSSPSEVKLSDILYADFDDAPFQLDYFSSNNSPGQLPADWKAFDVGHSGPPGSFTYTKGTFTLNGQGNALIYKEDRLYFVARPWTGDGQWTARLQPFWNVPDSTEGGLMLRESSDPSSVMLGMGLTALGGRAGEDPSPGWICFRGTAGEGPGVINGFSSNFPTWFRLTRNGASLGASFSEDGKNWNLIYQNVGKITASVWIGLFVTLGERPVSHVILDQVAFTPVPCLAQVIPPGVLLRSGSFLAGYFNALEIKPDKPDTDGNFLRILQNKSPVTIPLSKVAAVIMHPAMRNELAEKGSHVGLIMNNGDFLKTDNGSISGYGVTITSVPLGIVNYTQGEVRAWALRGLKPQPSDYEVRLTDGSSIRASGISSDNGRFIINEVSGVNVSVVPEEIAQLRAGPGRVQTLIDLPWKATLLSPASASPTMKANTNASPVTNVALTAKAAQAPTAPVECWTGPDQEQIMAVPAETRVDFPLAGKFRALAMRIALLPDAPPNSQMTLSILADGREIVRTPAFKTGDQPRFMEATLQAPQILTLVVNSVFAGARMLLIDPVAIK